jgi:hypothetical protein
MFMGIKQGYGSFHWARGPLSCDCYCHSSSLCCCHQRDANQAYSTFRTRAGEFPCGTAAEMSHARACQHTHLNPHTHIHIHARTHTYRHTHTHTHTYRHTHSPLETGSPKFTVLLSLQCQLLSRLMNDSKSTAAIACMHGQTSEL